MIFNLLFNEPVSKSEPKLKLRACSVFYVFYVIYVFYVSRRQRVNGAKVRMREC